MGPFFYADNPHRRRRRSRRRYGDNAVLPVQWNRGRRRRRYRRNAVLPIQWNPVAAGGILSGAQRFVDLSFWTDTAIPMVGGYIGTKFVGAQVSSFLASNVLKIGPGDSTYPWLRVGSEVLSVSALGWAASRYLSRRIGHAVFAGGALSVAISLLKLILPSDWQATVGLSGLGDGLGADLTDRMKAAVAQRVAAELSGPGMGTYLMNTDLQRQLSGPRNGVGEFINDVALRRQPEYSALPSASIAEYDVTSQREGIF